MSRRIGSAARRKFGAQVWIERGSRHILSQKEILENLPYPQSRTPAVTEAAVQRELGDYDNADVVVIPSIHVKESFLERRFPETRLFVNPYGTDLSMFPSTPAPPQLPLTILMVGAWSLRKGCDVLEKAWRTLCGVKLIHVGGVGDAPLPSGNEYFEHVNAVPQERLTEFYARAHVFVLASQEEGLAVVLPQALASGVPVVCTDRTGGEDLRENLDQPAAVTVVPHNDADALARAIASALQHLPPAGELRNLLGASREKLSWKRYGERYNEELIRRCGASGGKRQ